MSSPPGSPGAAAWRQEAEAVAADIAPHVSSVSPVSGDVDGALLDVTTLEGRRLTVRMSVAGFTICGDPCDPAAGRVYETPYALLHHVSPRYTEAFGRALAERLGQLEEQRQDEGDVGEGPAHAAGDGPVTGER